jgi:shikimate dehydrogenase
MAKKAFVVGWPIEHSLSPLIHRFWLQQNNLAGDYEKIAVHPDDIESFLRTAAQKGYVGGNVTIPHKAAAFKVATRLDPIAERLKVANTLVFEDDEIIASNTDPVGFLGNLDQNAPGWDQGSVSKTALLLGAGGAARSVALALHQRGFDLVITNRTVSRAREMISSLVLTADVKSLEQLNQLVPHADLIVNTTSLGMTGQPPLDIDLSAATRQPLITDIVYSPLKTPLIQAGKDAGFPVVTGLGMLLHQAVPGFQAWFGGQAPVSEELNNYILKALNDKQNNG